MNDGLSNRRASDPSHVKDPDPVELVDACKQLVRSWEEDYYATRAKTESELRVKRRHLGAARRRLDGYRRHHFYTTAEVARLLGVSERLVQAMAAQGCTSYRGVSGESIVLGLRTIKHRGYRFPKADIDRLVNSSRPVSRS